MIVYHESEYYDSPLSWESLRVLQNFLPREAYDQLLYRRSASVRRHYRFNFNGVAPRIQRDRFRNSRFRIVEAKKSEKETEIIYTLAS